MFPGRRRGPAPAVHGRSAVPKGLSAVIVHINGNYLDDREASVSIWDGGFLYGDGIYTTLRLYGGRPLDLPAHHARLRRHAADLDLPVPVDLASLEAIILQLAGRNGYADRDGRVRVTITRGADPERPLPLDRLETITPTLLVTLAPLPADLAAWQRDGIPVVCLPEGYARGNLPHLKTIGGITSLLALREAARAGCPDGILTGPGGRLYEGAVSNLFVVSGGQVSTPTAGAGFLAGRTRERVLGICGELSLPASEADLTRTHLVSADEAFLASSVREILPVVRVDGQTVGDGRPGPLTRAVQEAYRKKIAAGSPE